MKDNEERYLFSKDKGDSLEKVKSLLKIIESDFLNLQKIDQPPLLEILFYSVLTPLDAISNKTIKAALNKISTKYGHKFETADFLK